MKPELYSDVLSHVIVNVHSDPYAMPTFQLSIPKLFQVDWLWSGLVQVRAILSKPAPEH